MPDIWWKSKRTADDPSSWRPVWKGLPTKVRGAMWQQLDAIKKRHQKFLRANKLTIESFDADESWRQQHLDSPEIPVDPLKGRACQRPETQQQKDSSVKIRQNRKSFYPAGPNFQTNGGYSNDKPVHASEAEKNLKNTIAIDNTKSTTNLRHLKTW